MAGAAVGFVWRQRSTTAVSHNNQKRRLRLDILLLVRDYLSVLDCKVCGC